MLQRLRSSGALGGTCYFRGTNLEAMSGACLLGAGAWRQSSRLGPFANMQLCHDEGFPHAG